MTTIIALIALFAIIGIAFALANRRRLTPLANIGEGVWRGRKTFLSVGNIPQRYLLGKLGADDTHITLCGDADIPVGVITDEASADGSPINVNLFGSIDETQLMVASAAIALGDFVVPDAGGMVKPMPATTGSYNVVGRALRATPAGELAHIDPVFHQRTI